MSLIIETGVGVRNANAYVNAAYVLAYLTARNRQTENLWSTVSTAVQEAAIITATDYVENRFSHKFKGFPLTTFAETYAKATLTFSGLPSAAELLTIGDDVYKFVNSLTGAAYEVLIGASGTATAANLADAINGAVGAGITYGTGTPQSHHTAALLAGAVLTLTAAAPGASGALTVLTGPATNVAIVAFSGGKDGGLQPLSWPRSSTYDQAGNEILGIPDNLKQAVSEYAVRSLASALLPDPTVDPYGGQITSRSEEVGPIKEAIRYSFGTVGKFLFSPYPSADLLLRPLLLGTSGGVIRG